MATGKRTKSAGSGLGRNIGLLMIIVPLLFIFMPTVIFLGISMLPTFVAVVVDRSPRRYGAITVGGLNFAGTIPYLLTLWTGEHSVPQALTILSDIFALIMIFGSAAFGWLLFSATPSVVTAVLSMTSSRRLAALKAKQKQLLEEWGNEVAASADDDANPLGGDIGSAEK